MDCDTVRMWLTKNRRARMTLPPLTPNLMLVGHLYPGLRFAAARARCNRTVDRLLQLCGSAESENMNWILANTKPCPKCSRPIEKNQGCMHTTCQVSAAPPQPNCLPPPLVSAPPPSTPGAAPRSAW